MKHKPVLVCLNSFISVFQLPRLHCQLHCLLSLFFIVQISPCTHCIQLRSFIFVPRLPVCLSCLAGAFYFNQYSEYLFCHVFEYCLHSFITFHTLWTNYLELTNNQVNSSPFPQPLTQLIQQRCLNIKSM